jgi:hypothetical protein
VGKEEDVFSEFRLWENTTTGKKILAAKIRTFFDIIYMETHIPPGSGRNRLKKAIPGDYIVMESDGFYVFAPTTFIVNHKEPTQVKGNIEWERKY